MKIIILYDNTIYNEDLQADWRFSCLIELSENKRILFDTGACGYILIENMEKLNISPKTIDVIYISHNHFIKYFGGNNAKRKQRPIWYDTRWN